MREFSVSGQIATLSNNAQILAWIYPKAAPDVNLEITRAWVSQSGSNGSNQQRVQLITQVAATGTPGNPNAFTGVTPSPLKGADQISRITSGTTLATPGASGITAGTLPTQGSGTVTVLYEDSFNVLTGWLWQANGPDERIVVPASFASFFAIRLPVAPVSLTNWSFGFWFAER